MVVFCSQHCRVNAASCVRNVWFTFILSCCVAGVWDKVLEPVAERRNEAGSLKLFPVYLKGEDLFGLTVSAVTRIVESVSEIQSSAHIIKFGIIKVCDDSQVHF